MGSCAAPSAKGDDKFITTDYLQQCLSSYEVGRTEPPFSLVKKIAELLDYPANYFYTEDDDFAKAVLQFHRERTDPESNPHYNSVVIEARKLSSKLDKVRKTVAQLNEYLKE